MEEIPKAEYADKEVEHISKNLSKYKNELNSLEDEEKDDNFFMDKFKTFGMYSIIYHGLTTKFKLKAVESILISIIISLSNKHGYCFMGQRGFSKITGISIQTINKTLQNLEKRKIIERGKDKSKFGTIKWRITQDVKSFLDYIRIKINQNSSKNLNPAFKETLNNN